jgi:pilus assembly protein Flp/PilA
MLFPQSFDRGQGLLEYSLVIALIAIIVIVVLALLGPAVGNMFSNVVNYI